MACGLFVTWILGMALQQIGLLFHGSAGTFLQNSGAMAISLTGAGIGIGIASWEKPAWIISWRPFLVFWGAACADSGSVFL